MKEKILTIMTWVGMILILVGVILPLIQGPTSMPFRYVYATGAALNLVGRLFQPYKGPILRVKRLIRIEFWGSLFFCVAAYFMFTDPDPKNWIVFVLAGGAIMTYTSIMIPIAQRKKQ